MLELILTLWLIVNPVFSAVAIVSPTSAAGLRSASAVTVVLPLRSVLLPPAVDTVISPALTPAGTVKVTSCWSMAPSTTVRTAKLPTPRPSIVMARSLAVRPVPSSTMVLPATMLPPTDFSVGTTCKVKLAPLPSTVTAPLRASAGTVSVSVVPPAPTEPVRVRVPSVPLSSMPWNCTSVLPVKPWPVRVMVWPVLAEGTTALPALPLAALAVIPVNTLAGCTPKLAGICA